MDKELSKSVSTLERIKVWYEQAFPYPGMRDVHVRVSENLQQQSYLLNLLGDAGKFFEDRQELCASAQSLEKIKQSFLDQGAAGYVAFADINSAQFIDTLVNQIVTAIGIGQALGFDIPGALQAVAESNDTLLHLSDHTENPPNYSTFS